MRRRAALTAALAPMWLQAVAQPAQKERLGEPAPVFLKAGAMTYEAVHWGKAMGLGQNGGFLLARVAADRSVLWLHRIYAVDYRGDKEADKQDVFITSLALEPDGQALRIGDDRRRTHRFDLVSFQVRQLA